jgi:hypothetical protein
MIYSPTTLYPEGVTAVTPLSGGYGKEYELSFVGSTGKRWDIPYPITTGTSDRVFEPGDPLPTDRGVVDDAVTVIIHTITGFGACWWGGQVFGWWD